LSLFVHFLVLKFFMQYIKISSVAFPFVEVAGISSDKSHFFKLAFPIDTCMCPFIILYWLSINHIYFCPTVSFGISSYKAKFFWVVTTLVTYCPFLPFKSTLFFKLWVASQECRIAWDHIGMFTQGCNPYTGILENINYSIWGNLLISENKIKSLSRSPLHTEASILGSTLYQ